MPIGFLLWLTSLRTSLNAETSGPPVNLGLGKHRTRVSLPLRLVSGAHPSSHPEFEPGLLRMRCVYVITAMPSPSWLIWTTKLSLLRCRRHWQSAKPGFQISCWESAIVRIYYSSGPPEVNGLYRYKQGRTHRLLCPESLGQVVYSSIFSSCADPNHPWMSHEN